MPLARVRRGTTTCELVPPLGELLSEGRSAAGPRFGDLDPPFAPGPRPPPEDRGRRQADEAGGREHDRLEIPPKLELACRDRDADEREQLHLEEQHEERESEGGGPVRAPAPVREGDIDEVAHDGRSY